MKIAPPTHRALDVEEVRLVSDLRIMHAKVMELHRCVASLRARYSEDDVRKYADADLLAEDIALADEIYQFYVSMAEQRLRR